VALANLRLAVGSKRYAGLAGLKLDELKGCAARLPSRVEFSSEVESFKKSLANVEKLQGLVQLIKGPDLEEGKPAKSCKLDRSRAVYTCSYVISVTGRTPVSSEIFRLAANPVVFTVRFADDATALVNNTGFLQITDKDPEEPPDVSRWEVGAQIGFSVLPDTSRIVNVQNGAEFKDDVKSIVTKELPYEGRTSESSPATANLKLTQKLGNRAAASVAFDFKKGLLGDGKSDGQVKVPSYQLNLFGDNEVRLNFGKYAFASTRESVALAEEGEGIEWQWRWLSLGGLVKRQAAKGAKDTDTFNHRVGVLQIRNGSLGPFERTRNFNLLLLVGRNAGERFFVDRNGDRTFSDEEKKGLLVPYDYGTAGFEMDLDLNSDRETPTYKMARSKAAGIPNAKIDQWNYSANLTAYYSRRRVHSEDPASPIHDARGTSGLVTLAGNQVKSDDKGELTVPQQWSLLAGYGTGDDPKTVTGEGYLGESAAFAPDKLFLARFAGIVQDGVTPNGSLPPQVSGRVLVAPGLSNKTYLGFTYVNRAWESPLTVLAKSPWFDLEKSIVSQSTTLRLHTYRFNEAVFDTHWVGAEANLEWQIQVPKGVTSTVGLAYFQRASGLKEVIKKAPWSITLSTRVSL